MYSSTFNMIESVQTLTWLTKASQYPFIDCLYLCCSPGDVLCIFVSTPYRDGSTVKAAYLLEAVPGVLENMPERVLFN